MTGNVEQIFKKIETFRQMTLSIPLMVVARVSGLSIFFDSFIHHSLISAFIPLSATVALI